MLDRTALHLAALKGHLESVKLLVENGAEIDATDTFSNTPLHYASENAHGDVVAFLLESGAHVNVRNHVGMNCLDVCRSVTVRKIFAEKGVQNQEEHLEDDFDKIKFEGVLTFENNRKDRIGKLFSELS